MTRDEIKSLLRQVIDSAVSRGRGWAQEGVVLRMVSEQVSARGQTDLATEQAVLEVWHDLFAEKELAWGYNLENPGAPFFHRRQSA